MEENLSKFVTAILAIIIMFIFPVYIAYEKKDDISYALAVRYTQDFVDKVRSKGYITRELYQDYATRLLTTGNTYDIELEHRYVRFDPANTTGSENVKAVRGEEVYSTEHILNFMDNNIEHKYVMNVDDTFNVKIKNTNVTMATVIYNIVTVNMSKNNVRIHVDYGGKILADKWWGNIGFFPGGEDILLEYAPIPEGFYYVGGTKDTGLVISDNVNDANKGVDYACEGNQFVWIPVDDYTQFVRLESDDRYVEPYINGYDKEVEEYDAMCNSVKKYGGFYIARFEAGDSYATEIGVARSEITEARSIVSKKGAYVYNYVKWGEAIDEIGENGAVYLSQNMYKDHASVVSTLCYGVQWDAVMNFVSDEDHNVNDSRKWGNYKDSIEAAATNKGILQQTGTNEAWKAKNIYDLAGNVWEWTMESGSLVNVGRVARSGAYCNNGFNLSAFNRNPLNFNYFQYDVGFRVALYLK